MKKIGSFVGGRIMNCSETSTYEKSEIIKNVIVGGMVLEVLT